MIDDKRLRINNERLVRYSFSFFFAKLNFATYPCLMGEYFLMTQRVEYSLVYRLRAKIRQGEVRNLPAAVFVHVHSAKCRACCAPRVFYSEKSHGSQ